MALHFGCHWGLAQTLRLPAPQWGSAQHDSPLWPCPRPAGWACPMPGTPPSRHLRQSHAASWVAAVTSQARNRARATLNLSGAGRLCWPTAVAMYMASTAHLAGTSQLRHPAETVHERRHACAPPPPLGTRPPHPSPPAPCRGRSRRGSTRHTHLKRQQQCRQQGSTGGEGGHEAGTRQLPGKHFKAGAVIAAPCLLLSLQPHAKCRHAAASLLPALQLQPKLRCSPSSPPSTSAARRLSFCFSCRATTATSSCTSAAPHRGTAQHAGEGGHLTTADKHIRRCFAASQSRSTAGSSCWRWQPAAAAGFM
jgi:hypothetical protein